MKNILIIFSAVLLLAGCTEQQKTNDKPVIVCTTGMIGDAVKNLMDTTVQVEVLMGPGVDPHLYKATQGDINSLTKADVVVYNGLHLEGKMGEIFEKLSHQKTTIAVGEQLQEDRLINSTAFQGAEDPHIWFDVALWSDALIGVAAELKKEYPAKAELIDNNLAAYRQKLDVLDKYARQQVRSIPEDQRVMVTAHDAFKYFGRAYGMEVKGLQGISTTAEYGLQDVSRLVNEITERQIKAIFVESSVPKKSIEAVIEGCQSRGHNVKLGGELYSDAMGAAGTSEGTYLGMVRYNVNTITEALK